MFVPARLPIAESLFVVINTMSAPTDSALSANNLKCSVEPEPEIITNTSFDLIAGVVDFEQHVPVCRADLSALQNYSPRILNVLCQLQIYVQHVVFRKLKKLIVGFTVTKSSLIHLELIDSH